MTDAEADQIAEIEQNWLFVVVRVWTVNAVCCAILAALTLVLSLRQTGAIALWCSVAAAVFLLTAVLSGVASKSIRARARWMFVIGIAAFCCLQPGTSLISGATTLVLLFRPTVRALFT